MFRLLPLLALAWLPAAVAAPVPPGGRVEFGRNGLLTRADLEKVKFDSWPIPSAGRKPKTRAGKFDIAVHMPWTRFREGEPIPVYFVLRNNSDSNLTINNELELFRPHPVVWGSCRIRAWDLATDESVRVVGQACSFNEQVIVPARGFYCLQGDFGRTCGGEPLPAGEYEVDWEYSGLCSAPAQFTITKADVKPTEPAMRPHLHFYHLLPDFNPNNRPGGVGEPLVARE